jgi:hypothetical protein
MLFGYTQHLCIRSLILKRLSQYSLYGAEQHRSVTMCKLPSAQINRLSDYLHYSDLTYVIQHYELKNYCYADEEYNYI